MSTKINIAVVATVLALVAAPQLASAQQAIFLPCAGAERVRGRLPQ